MMKCQDCGDLCGVPIIYKTLKICERCFNHTKLPQYQLTKLWTTTAFYDPRSGRYFPDAERTLKDCGFKLYRKFVFSTKLANPSYREIWIYRYFGNVACPLIDIKWPTRKIECRSTHCGQR